MTFRTLSGLALLCACSSGLEASETYDAGSAQFSRLQTGPASPEPPPSTFDEMLRNTYDVAYGVCGDRPEKVYEEAGSKKVHDAAEWYSEGSREGAHRAASYRSCADALLGNPKSF